MGRHGVAAKSMEGMTEENHCFAMIPVQDVLNAKQLILGSQQQTQCEWSLDPVLTAKGKDEFRPVVLPPWPADIEMSTINWWICMVWWSSGMILA